MRVRTHLRRNITSKTIIKKVVNLNISGGFWLSDKQYRFHGYKSTVDVLTVIINVHNKSITREITSDISKDFDKVWCWELLHKLFTYGILDYQVLPPDWPHKAHLTSMQVSLNDLSSVLSHICYILTMCQRELLPVNADDCTAYGSTTKDLDGEELAADLSFGHSCKDKWEGTGL